jgi:hypothetical protein
MDLGSGVGNTALVGGTLPDSTFVSSLTITGRGAHDAVTVAPSVITGDLDVALTGRGANTIAVDGVFVGGDTSLTALGGGNEIRIDDQAPGSLFVGRVGIDMTGRNNLLSINSQHRTPSRGTTTFEGEVTADLGRGGSTLHLGLIGDVEFDAESTFNGGRGHNFAVVGSVTGVDPTIVHFE